MTGPEAQFSVVSALWIAGPSLVGMLSVLLCAMAVDHLRVQRHLGNRLARYNLHSTTSGTIADTRWLQKGDMLRRLGCHLARRSGSDRLQRVRDELVRAGLIDRLTPEELLALRLLATVVGVGLGSLLTVFVGPLASLAVVLGGVLGYLLPSLVLRQLALARRSTIERLLPDIIDMVAISLQAGLSFDGAIAFICERIENPLVAELRHYLADLLLGRSRREALDGVFQRTGSAEVGELTAAVSQAEEMGTSLARTLRSQAKLSRDMRRVRAEEKARKAPIQLLFPIILCIMPVLFIVILGPVVLKVAAVMGV